MELSLSWGGSATPCSFRDKATKLHTEGLSFCIGLGGGAAGITGKASESEIRRDARASCVESRDYAIRAFSDPPLPLDLLPSSPVPRSQHPSSPLRIPWLTAKLAGVERVSSDEQTRGLDMNRSTVHTEEADDGGALSSPNSAMSSLQMEFCMKNNGYNAGKGKRDAEVDAERGSSRGLTDDEDNGSTRKKLRLSKEQSAYLEESFKEHTTLNPKQKLALAKQLSLLPRQVEVWFQKYRRARTKLKQTEVDCGYMKRCCETLTEENRRLRKELQELRALKSSQPFYKQLPPTTLTMCPSCERVATKSSSSSVPANRDYLILSNTLV